jgi:signal transduction histidine kinase
MRRTNAMTIGDDPGSPAQAAQRASDQTVAQVALAAILLSALAAAIALRGGMPNPGWLALRNGLAICVPVAVGLYAWRDGTHARFGRLLVLGGLGWFLVALAGSGDPLVYTIGRIAGWLSEIGIAYLVLAFPTGRLPGRIDRLLVLAVVLLMGVLYIPTALLVDHFPSPTTYMTCFADCPANAFALVDTTPAWIADVVIPVREAIAILLPLLIIWRIADRLRHATPLMRRALTPVLWVAMLRLLTLAVAIFVRREDLLSDRSMAWLIGALALTLPLLSLGFLIGLVSWRLYTADALLVLARRLRLARGAEERHAAIAEAVMDPGLDIAYPGPTGAGWVTAEGWPVTLPAEGSGRTATIVEDAGQPVAALIHAGTLAEQRAFVEAVGTYALVWDENERLAASVDSSRGELRASRARILAAADDERRRIERDLHDGGQQRLVALRIRLQLAEDMMAASPKGAQEMLHRLVDDVDGVLEELRALATGVFPAMLAAHGLPAAVRDAAAQSPLPVHVVIKGSERHPVEVETAAYFCCLEALQNVAKHARGATGARVLLELDGDLVFEVRDDGPGFDVATTGTHGLLNMRDRVAALGGTLEVHSSAGSGTSVRGRLPGGRVGLPEPAEGRGPELLLADEHRGA